MQRDQETLLRMNLLIQAARLYENEFPEYSRHFLYDFIQLSQKKIIRIDKKLKKKINKKAFTFKKKAHYLGQFIDRSSYKPEEGKMVDQGQE